MDNAALDTGAMVPGQWILKRWITGFTRPLLNLSHIITKTLFASFTEVMFGLITQNERSYSLSHDIISTSASHCPHHVLARNCLLLNILLGLLTFNVQIVLLFFTLINYEVSRKELSLREKSFIRLFELQTELDLLSLDNNFILNC